MSRGMSDASIATRFQPGSGGNPKGRKKKGESLAATLERYGHKKNPKTKKRFIDDMVKATWERAAGGDMDAIKYIFDRALGRPAQEIKLEGQPPALVFQIIDPRLPLPEPEQGGGKYAPVILDVEPQQDVVEGEVASEVGTAQWAASLHTYGDTDHQPPDSDG